MLCIVMESERQFVWDLYTDPSDIAKSSQHKRFPHKLLNEMNVLRLLNNDSKNEFSTSTLHHKNRKQNNVSNGSCFLQHNAFARTFEAMF